MTDKKPWAQMKLSERIEEALSCCGLSNTPTANGPPETYKYIKIAESILDLQPLGTNYYGQEMVRYYKSSKKARLAVIQAVIDDCNDHRPAVILQVRRKGLPWQDCCPSFFAVFEDERDLAEERVKDLNKDKLVRAYGARYRVKPQDRVKPRAKK